MSVRLTPSAFPLGTPDSDVLDHFDSTISLTPVAFLLNTPCPEVYTCAIITTLCLVNSLSTPVANSLKHAEGLQGSPCSSALKQHASSGGARNWLGQTLRIRNDAWLNGCMPANTKHNQRILGTSGSTQTMSVTLSDE